MNNMIIGIDLGTTNSLATYISENGEIKFIKSEHGNIMIPSVVGLSENGEIIVGEIAKERLITHPTITTNLFKRKMGTKKNSRLGNQVFTAVELSAFVLKYIRQNAERELNCTVSEAIVTVPAYFNDKQRKDTMKAAKLAGIKVERIINEPTAAAIAYEHEILKEDLKFMVLDLGGGKFDVKILESFDEILEVISISGDSFLGGEDFTQILFDMFLEKNSLIVEELTLNEYAYIYNQVDRAKRASNNMDTIEIKVSINELNLQTIITLQEYRKKLTPLIIKIKSAVDKALRGGKVSMSEIEKVILVGGATRMPIIEEFIRAYFLKETGRKTTDDFICSSLNPDQAIAYGAGIAVGMKERNVTFREKIMTDVCPFSLGIGVIGGRFAPIIERNMTIPTSRSEYFVTVFDNQQKINVVIFQGENLKVSENIKLGELIVNVPFAAKGQEGIFVRFTYDINGVLEVETNNPTTNETRKIVISDDSLSDIEIENIKLNFDKLKILPINKSENQLLLSRGSRIFGEVNGDTRRYIQSILEDFEHFLLNAKEIEIIKKRQEINKIFDKYDLEVQRSKSINFFLNKDFDEEDPNNNGGFGMLN